MNIYNINENHLKSYDKNNKPQRFYCYLYLREDGSPWYVGKGTNRRAIERRKGHWAPTNHSKIKIVKDDMTENDAFSLEVFLIAYYGRKNLSNGILNNQTSGGEGASGLIVSEDTKAKLSELNRGEKHPMYGKTEKLSPRFGMKHSPETKSKLSENHPFKGKFGYQNPTSKRHIVLTPDGSFCLINGLSAFCRENQLDQGSMSKVALGKRKHHKGYKCRYYTGFQDMRRIILSKEMLN